MRVCLRGGVVLGMMLLYMVQLTEAQGCSASCGNNALCEGDKTTFAKTMSTCWPRAAPAELNLRDYFVDDEMNISSDTPLYITVMANHYTGCNAGRREASVFQDVATRVHNDEVTSNVNFVTALHGGGDCGKWADIFANDGADNLANTPWTINDSDYVLRDEFFTAPFPHPSYVLLDWEGRVRHKLVGPCCGYESYSDCPEETAATLDATLTDAVMELVSERDAILAAVEDVPEEERCSVSEWGEWGNCAGTCGGNQGIEMRTRTIVSTGAGGRSGCPFLVETRTCTTAACDPVDCAVSDWKSWSACSHVCGDGGTRWRSRDITTVAKDGGAACPALAEEQPCSSSAEGNNGTQITSPCPDNFCVPEFGAAWTVEAVPIQKGALHGPRDIAFSPMPGVHLGKYSSGRSFPIDGDEAWVANAFGHSLSVVPGLGGENEGAALERTDRGTTFAFSLSLSLFSDHGVSYVFVCVCVCVCVYVCF